MDKKNFFSKLKKLEILHGINSKSTNNDISIINYDAFYGNNKTEIKKVKSALQELCNKPAIKSDKAESKEDALLHTICAFLHKLSVYLVSNDTMVFSIKKHKRTHGRRTYYPRYTVLYGKHPETGEQAIFVCPQNMGKEKKTYVDGGGGPGMGFLTQRTEVIKYLLDFSLMADFAKNLLKNESLKFEELTPEQKKAYNKLEESAAVEIALEMVKALDDEKLLQEANEYIEKIKQEGSIYEIRSDSWLNWGEKKSDPQSYPKLDATEKEVEEFLNA